MIESGYILRPANPLFIAASLIAATLLNFLPLGNAPWVPDWLLICLVFWTIHQPRKVGVIWAFCLGCDGFYAHPTSFASLATFHLSFDLATDHSLDRN